MVYLHAFSFPNEDMEFDFFMNIKRTCYDSFYPFKILSKKCFESIVFEPVTIIYGGNGSGKSTALNVIAEKRESNVILSIINLTSTLIISICVICS